MKQNKLNKNSPPETVTLTETVGVEELLEEEMEELSEEEMLVVVGGMAMLPSEGGGGGWTPGWGSVVKRGSSGSSAR